MPRSIPAEPKDFFLQRGRGTGAGTPSDQQIRVLLRLDGHLDLARLERAVAAVVGGDPILRARFVEPRRFQARWELRDDPEAVPACELAEVGGEGPAEAAIAAFLADLEVRDGGPYFRLRVVRRPGRDALCLRIDHRLCDGGGAKELVYRVADAYRRLAAGEPLPPPRPDFGPRTVAGLAGCAPGPAPAEVQPFRQLTYAIPRLGSANERPALVVRVLDANTVAAVRRGGKPLGATLTDAMLTAMVRALQPHALVPAGAPLSVMVSADYRTRLPPGARDVVCNLSQGFFPELRCDPAQGFGAALAEVAREMGRIRAGFTLEDALRGEAAFAVTFARWASDPEWPGRASRRETTFVLLSNVGVLDEGRLDLGAPAVTDGQMLGTVALGPELLLCASSFRGALTLSTGYCASDVAPALIEGVVDRTAAELAAFAAATG